MDSAYAFIRGAHLAAVMLSGCLFMGRGAAMLLGFPGMMRPALRYASYAIDTVLLASAVALAAVLALNPLSTPWLALKIGLVVLYIVLGSFALKRARTRQGKAIAYAAALICFILIAHVAHTRETLFP
ncbi:SirB2 family protein [Kerstersia similis]|uniref:SirB2 family protein n=1 Tax=Kerstersia similis TaxID=206505 RepID=UPI0039EF1C98